METTSETKPVTPGELIEVTQGLRKLGVAGFSYRGCEVTFYEPLPLEMQADSEEPEDTERLKRVRRQMLDADIHGSA
jgi:hypothetical protein